MQLQLDENSPSNECRDIQNRINSWRARLLWCRICLRIVWACSVSVQLSFHFWLYDCACIWWCNSRTRVVQLCHENCNENLSLHFFLPFVVINFMFGIDEETKSRIIYINFGWSKFTTIHTNADIVRPIDVQEMLKVVCQGLVHIVRISVWWVVKLIEIPNPFWFAYYTTKVDVRYQWKHFVVKRLETWRFTNAADVFV